MSLVYLSLFLYMFSEALFLTMSCASYLSLVDLFLAPSVSAKVFFDFIFVR